MDKTRLDMTRHAVKRSQQRGITEEEMEFVIEFGEERYVGEGCYSYSMGKRSRLKAKAELGDKNYRRFAELDVYVIVLPDGAVRTVAHKDDRIRRYH